MRGDEGTRFLVDFEALKTETGNSPAMLEASWREREDLKALCDRLAEQHRSFHWTEDWTPFAFTSHVPAAASRARRDYDERWQRAVARVANRELLDLFENIFSTIDFAEDDAGDPLERDIEGWKYGARSEGRNIDYAFDCIADQRANDEHGDFEWVDDAQRSWERLKRVVGLDVEGAFWRRAAIPHILFPSHVSNHYGPESASIYRRLLDAGRAFTFGAPLAALAMQRAVLEELLERHWGSPKGIVQGANLPSLSHDARATRLKRIANKAMHGEPEQLTAHEIDREIVKNFLLLRELIEAVPDRG